MSNRYEITSLIEKDHLGEVFLAQDTTLQRKVVFRKFGAKLKPQKKQRGKKKTHAIAENFGEYTGKLCALQHPNLLTIYDIDSNDEGHFMVTQFVEAELLVDRLAQGPLSQVGVHNMASDLLDALHAVHSVGLFHGALRLDSVKRLARVRGGHRYLVVDLGLDEISSMVTGRQGVMADTVLIAPELLSGENEVNTSSDLFALGQLCYVCLAGGHPMAGHSVAECSKIYREGGMPHIQEYAAGVQPDFAQWIMSLVASDPSLRPASTEEAMASLHAITLNAPQPNVPGVTQAVAEVADYAQTQISQAITVSEPQSKQAILDQFMSLSQKTRFMLGGGVAVLLLLLFCAF